MAWLGRLERLGEAEICSLVPVLDASGEVDAMRRLIRLCPLLANPARVLDTWLERPIHELVTELFQLRMVAGVLIACAHGERPEIFTPATWCRRVLAEHAHDDADERERLMAWVAELVAQHG